MPAIRLSPELRRLMSDEARKVFTLAYDAPDVNLRGSGGGVPPSQNWTHLTLPERLQNFKASVRFEIPELNTAIQVIVVVAGRDTSYQYHIEETGAEITILSKAGVNTKWLTHRTGKEEQLQDYMNRLDQDDTEHMIVTAFLEMLEVLDLVEVFQASHLVDDMGTFPQPNGNVWQRYFACTNDKGHSYLFEVEHKTGRPVCITQELEEDLPNAIKTIRMVVETYVRCYETVPVPSGIQSDLQVAINTSMELFHNEWMPQTKQVILDIFNEIDADEDGFVSGWDVSKRLQRVGQSEATAQRTGREMTRLLCDQGDPSEEFNFHQFCGFWMIMLADGEQIVNAHNQIAIANAMQHLFYRTSAS